MGLITSEIRLNEINGLDAEVVDFLQNHDEVEQMLDYIRNFLQTWIPKFEQQNRYYLTISIGCTGGQHRSVYLTEQIVRQLNDGGHTAQADHRELR